MVGRNADFEDIHLRGNPAEITFYGYSEMSGFAPTSIRAIIAMPPNPIMPILKLSRLSQSGWAFPQVA
jgi:hypothetical protein